MNDFNNFDNDNCNSFGYNHNHNNFNNNNNFQVQNNLRNIERELSTANYNARKANQLRELELQFKAGLITKEELAEELEDMEYREAVATKVGIIIIAIGIFVFAFLMYMGII